MDGWTAVLAASSYSYEGARLGGARSQVLAELFLLDRVCAVYEMMRLYTLKKVETPKLGVRCYCRQSAVCVAERGKEATGAHVILFCLLSILPYRSMVLLHSTRGFDVQASGQGLHARRRTRTVTAVLVDAASTSSSSSTPPGLEEDRGEAKVPAAAVSPEAEADEDTVHMDKTVD
jgi:hypothetical protein